MQFRVFKLRFRRRVKKGQHQLEDLSSQTEQQIERHFFKRLDKFSSVWRFMTAWILLFVLVMACLVTQLQALSGYYQTTRPVAGGIYTEGVLGSFTNANPLYATSEVDTTVSHLMFSGLLKYDDDNQLVGDLADRWGVDAKGTTYTVHLRPNLTWQDGHPLTAADVVYTYHAIQNPDAQSPLSSSWQGITVKEVNSRTITFTLPNPLSSFIYTLTNGIVPLHLLGGTPMADLRSVNFNTQSPVGSGPFEWSAIQVSGNTPETAQVSLGLKPFEDYWAGAPKLKSFVVHAYADQAQMVHDYQSRQLTAMAGLSDVPSVIAKDGDLDVHNMIQTAATMVFFKNSTGVLADAKVRQALVLGANTSAIMAHLSYSTKPVREPLLIGQIGYDPTYNQVTGNSTVAGAALDADGWVMGPNGLRSKAGQTLGFALYADDNSEYAQVSQQLAAQWKHLGVQVTVRLQSPEDFQTTLSTHSYDAVLHGIAIGVDPDVYVYWDSSQSDIRSANRLNLSEYKSAVADDALEAGRTRLDPTLRAIKYKPFLQAWQTDAPALGLYQPRFLYISHGTVYGLTDHTVNTDTDRFSNVNSWMIRTARITN